MAWVPKGWTYAQFVSGNPPANIPTEFKNDDSEGDDNNNDDNWEDDWGGDWGLLMARIRKHPMLGEDSVDTTTVNVNQGDGNMDKWLKGTTDKVSGSIASEMIKWMQTMGMENLSKLSDAELYDEMTKIGEIAGDKAVDDALNEYSGATAASASERDCVRVTDVPKKYESGSKMVAFMGICGYQFQITNIQDETLGVPFGVKVLQRSLGGYYALSTAGALAASLLVFF